MTSAPIYSVADFLSALQKLMPRGAAWRNDTDSIQAKTEEGLVKTWNRVNVADHNLLIDCFPATAVGMLPEWEAALGLPDPCAGEAQTIAQRQALVVAKLTNSGGQSAQYFIDAAAALGYDITITSDAPFRAGQSHAGDPLGGVWSWFTWTVEAPLTSSEYFRAGSGHAGEPLQTWGNDVLECVIEALAPAHTDVDFVYGSDIPEGFGVDFGSGLFYKRTIGGAPVVYPAFTDLFTFTRSTPGTYRDAAGMLQTAAINVPRIECGPDGVLQGLLLEEIRQNQCLRSQEFDNAAWIKNVSSVGANAAVAPDGSTTADVLIEDTSTGFHYAAQNITVVAGQTYVFSAFAKARERTFAQIQLGGLGFPQSFTLCNLLTGTFQTGNSAIAGGVEKFANGWWRIWVKATATGTGGAPLVGLSNGVASNYLGDGVSGIYVWGAQLELAGAMSSYIATTSVAVNRGADVCYRPVGGEYNPLAGTGVVAGTTAPAQNATLAQVYWNFDDGTTVDRLGLLRPSPTDSLAFRGFSGSVFQCGCDFNSGNLLAFKSAAAWRLDDFAQSVNGAAAVVDNAGLLPASIAMFALGNFNLTATNYGNCHIKKFTYYPTRKSNAELQTLSA